MAKEETDPIRIRAFQGEFIDCTFSIINLSDTPVDIFWIHFNAHSHDPNEEVKISEQPVAPHGSSGTFRSSVHYEFELREVCAAETANENCRSAFFQTIGKQNCKLYDSLHGNWFYGFFRLKFVSDYVHFHVHVHAHFLA